MNALRVLERVAPSLVVAAVRRRGGPATAPAAMIGPGVAAGYEILCRSGSWADLVDIPVHQGDRSWLAEVSNERPDWQTCGLDLSPDPDLPTVSPRWSWTLREGEPVLAIEAEPVSDPVDLLRVGDFTAIEGAIYQVFPPDDEKRDFEPYERSLYAAAVFRAIPSDGAMVFDAEGLLVGCIEVSRERGADRIIVPGEWLTGYWTFHWMYALLHLSGAAPDALGRAAELFERRKDSVEDSRLFCAAHEVFARMGRGDEAAAALKRASELDPENPWIRDRLRASAPLEGR